MDQATKTTSTTGQGNWRKPLRRIGVLLYVLALLAPPHWNPSGGINLGGGLIMLIETPVWAIASMTRGIQPARWQAWLLGLSLILGWTANLWICFRMPPVTTLFAMTLPWILFAGVTYLENVTGVSKVAIDFIPFYPWAVSIALIHGSRLGEPSPTVERRSIWNGF